MFLILLKIQREKNAKMTIYSQQHDLMRLMIFWRLLWNTKKNIRMVRSFTSQRMSYLTPKIEFVRSVTILIVSHIYFELLFIWIISTKTSVVLKSRFHCDVVVEGTLFWKYLRRDDMVIGKFFLFLLFENRRNSQMSFNICFDFTVNYSFPSQLLSR
jgi:hypothetical protein